jgi:DNA excision repair protein ERCC-3
LDTESIVSVLGKLSKVLLLSSLTDWITDCTMSFGKAKLVLRQNCHWIECSSRDVMAELLTDEEIEAARDPNPAIVQPRPTATAAAADGGGGAAASSADASSSGTRGSDSGADATHGEGDAASADDAGLDDDALEQMMQDWEEVSGSDYDPRHSQQHQQKQQQKQQQQKEKKTDGLPSSSSSSSAASSQTDPSQSASTDDATYLEALANGSVSELGDIVAPWEVAANSAGEQVFKFALRNGQAEAVKERCIERQTPLLEEYDFRHDSRNAPLRIESKPMVHLRDYQEKSLKQMFSTGCARSGVIVLPCGAGKTLTGLMAAVTIKKATLVLCVNTLSVEQWREHFNTNTTIEFKDIHVLTSERRPPHNFLSPGTVDQPARGAVVITTYPMVTYSGKRNEVSDRAMTQIRNTEWGLLILDEVHQVPARTFRRVLSTCKAHCKLGLTATLVREDERISDLHFLIGPKLYEANWLDLAAAGHLARVQCTEMWTPMTSEFFSEYLKADGMGGGRPMPWRRQLLYSMNPNKVRTCSYLIDFHEAKYDKILVFCDNLYCLKRYAGVMKRPYICGAVKQSDRARLLEQFKTSDEVNCLFISRVGDTAIDLPSATVIIQIACTDGSRRQEAQRLGRILRPKDRQVDSTEPNAFFYSLVSRDTDEVFYAAKRQSFLVDQGYSFKVLPVAAALTDAPGLPFESRQSQLQLLAEVLACGETEELEDELSFPTTMAASGGASAASAMAASAAAAAAANTLAPVRRTGGSLSELSGGAGLAYQEFNSVEERDEVRQGLQRHVPAKT